MGTGRVGVGGGGNAAGAVVAFVWQVSDNPAMGRYFRAEVAGETEGVTTVRIGFGEPGTNTEIVPDAVAAMADLPLAGGRGIHLNGPASLPVAMAIAHAVAHRYGYVACYDPKLLGYVVAISHDPSRRVGELVPGGAVTPG